MHRILFLITIMSLALFSSSFAGQVTINYEPGTKRYITGVMEQCEGKDMVGMRVDRLRRDPNRTYPDTITDSKEWGQIRCMDPPWSWFGGSLGWPIDPNEHFPMKD